MVSEEELKNMSPEEIAEMQKKNCIFCHIVSGKVPSKKIYEDDKCIGILDINPASPGHILLIPKTHYVIMPQIPEEEIGYLFKVAKIMSSKLLSILKVAGTNIFVANGAVAGQKAPHFMIHIIPRNEGDGLNFSLSENDVNPDELEQMRKELLPKIGQIFNIQTESPQEDVSHEDQPDEESKDNDPQDKQPEDKQEEQPEDKEKAEESEEDVDIDKLKAVLDGM